MQTLSASRRPSGWHITRHRLVVAMLALLAIAGLTAAASARGEIYVSAPLVNHAGAATSVAPALAADAVGLVVGAGDASVNASVGIARTVAAGHGYSWCTWAVVGAIYGLGAALILLFAGEGIGIVVAGRFIAGWLLRRIAAVLGSVSAVYNLVAAYVC